MNLNNLNDIVRNSTNDINQLTLKVRDSYKSDSVDDLIKVRNQIENQFKQITQVFIDNSINSAASVKLKNNYVEDTSKRLALVDSLISLRINPNTSMNINTFKMIVYNSMEEIDGFIVKAQESYNSDKGVEDLIRIKEEISTEFYKVIELFDNESITKQSDVEHLKSNYIKNNDKSLLIVDCLIDNKISKTYEPPKEKLQNLAFAGSSIGLESGGQISTSKVQIRFKGEEQSGTFTGVVKEPKPYLFWKSNVGVNVGEVLTRLTNDQLERFLIYVEEHGKTTDPDALRRNVFGKAGKEDLLPNAVILRYLEDPDLLCFYTLDLKDIVAKPNMSEPVIHTSFDLHERDILSYLSETMGRDNPSVMRLSGQGTNNYGEEFYVVEYVPGISTERFFEQNALIPLLEFLNLGYGLSKGLEFIHEAHVRHSDIKADNIMRREVDGSYMIIDFGDSIVCEKNHPLNLEKAGVVSSTPEKAEAKTTKSDCWLAGMMLAEILFGHDLTKKITDDLNDLQKPLKDLSGEEKKIIQNRIHFLIDNARDYCLQGNRESSYEIQECTAVIKKLLTYDLKERLSAKDFRKQWELLQQSTLQKIKKGEVPESLNKTHLELKRGFDVNVQRAIQNNLQTNKNEIGFSYSFDQSFTTHVATPNKPDVADLLIETEKIKSDLGKGCAGTVKLVEVSEKNGQTIKLAKKVPMPVLDEKSYCTLCIDDLSNEAVILKTIGEHPNIIGYRGSGTTSKKWEKNNAEYQEAFIYIELADGGDLEKMLQKGPLEPEKAIQFAKDLITGLQFLASRGIVHQDLKPNNLFISGNTLKIADFGVASSLFAPGSVGAGAYLSPEGIKRTINERSDLWSGGIDLMYMIAPQTVAKTFNKRLSEIIFKKSGATQYEISNLLDETFGSFPHGNEIEKLKEVIVGFLQIDPLERLPHDQALSILS